jgi:hypothetical protein
LYLSILYWKGVGGMLSIVSEPTQEGGFLGNRVAFMFLISLESSFLAFLSSCSFTSIAWWNRHIPNIRLKSFMGEVDFSWGWEEDCP